jgi:hypothetical protein
MPYKLISPRAIKWASQRALADYWDRLAAGRPFPAFTELKSEPGMYDPKQFIVWNVEGQGRQRKFRAVYQSENVAEVFSASWLGKTMDEVVPISLRRFIHNSTGKLIREKEDHLRHEVMKGPPRLAAAFIFTWVHAALS